MGRFEGQAADSRCGGSLPSRNPRISRSAESQIGSMTALFRECDEFGAWSCYPSAIKTHWRVREGIVSVPFA